MPVLYVIVFQRCKGEIPPFPSKILFDSISQWSTKHGLFRKAVCSVETYKSKKAAMEASKNYKKIIKKGKSCFRYERPGNGENTSTS